MQVVNNKSGHLLLRVAEAEKAISDGDFERASLLMYEAIRAAMARLAKERNLPYNNDDDLLHLAKALDKEHGTNRSHFVRFEAARGMFDNSQLNFLGLEDTLMAPENAREFISRLGEYQIAA